MKQRCLYYSLGIRLFIVILFCLLLIKSEHHWNNIYAQFSINQDDVSVLNDFIELNGLTNLSPTMLGLQKWNFWTGRLERLVINNYQIDVVPETISKLTELHYLDLSYNIIFKLPVNLSNVSNLDTLIISGNLLKDIPADIGKLSRLRCLVLDNNSIGGLPGSFVQLGNLRYLSLGANAIRELPNLTISIFPPFFPERYMHFSNLSNLQYLNLAGNPLKLKSEDFYFDQGSHGSGQLDNLRELYLDNTHLSYLPSTIDRLGNLERLSLSKDTLLIMPREIGNLHKLKFLNFESNYLTSLPSDIFNLTQLRTLILSGNRLFTVQNGLGRLKKLQYLALSNNLLLTLPDDIADIDSLQTLVVSQNLLSKFDLAGTNIKRALTIDLSNNRLTEISGRIGDFDSLQSLNLNYNNLKNLPSAISRLHNLKVLSIHHNELEELPAEFGNMGSGLKVLDLQYNLLKSLPESFGRLKGMVNQSLQYNLLESLPESYGDLSSIKVLDLSYNKLRGLPESFGRLEIVNLIITNNLLSDLPKSFGDLDSLVLCDLSSNNLKSMPMSILNFKHPLATINLANNYISAIPDTFCTLMLVNLDITMNDLYCEEGLQNTSKIPQFLLTANPYPIHVNGLFNQRCFTPENLADREKFKLYEPFPNPFNPSTNIHFYVPKNGDVDLGVYNILGQKVTTIFSGYLGRGYYRNKWVTGNISSGMYIVGLKSDNIFLTQKVLLIK